MNHLLKKLLTSNNFLSLANNGLVAVFSFLSFFMLVRALPQETFGEWVLLITTGGFIDMLRFGITRTAVIRFVAGADEGEAKALMGANSLINLLSTILVAITLFSIYQLFEDQLAGSGFLLFFKWYPLLALFNLGFNNAQSVLQAKMRFDHMLLLRMINVLSFMLFLIYNIWSKFSIDTIVWAYLITNLISSLIASAMNWDGIRHTFQANKQAVRTILNFGKYTTGTLIGSNLLKSSDTFIIGLSSFMGPAGVAVYSIPLKLTEIIEIPLRSFAGTAFPSMSKAAIEGKLDETKRIFYQNAGGTTLLMIPLMTVCFIFAEQIVWFLGGSDYVVSANIFRIFCIYGLLLPIDRFIGVTLDSVNMPRQNFYKVLFMALFNIIGDAIVVFGLSKIILGTSWLTLIAQGISPDDAYRVAHGFSLIKSLELVAIVTILFTLLGIVIGFGYLDNAVKLNKNAIFAEGYKVLRSNWTTLRGNIKLNSQQ
ncbi:MAG TPA: oligosaccharide flippase family protein [Bacteroidales bacterium]|nr:oligosaccharide flippase family protein [Bacteroidales bacterium]